METILVSHAMGARIDYHLAEARRLLADAITDRDASAHASAHASLARSSFHSAMVRGLIESARNGANSHSS